MRIGAIAVVATAVFLVIFVPAATSAPYKVLYGFESPPTHLQDSLVLGTDGSLYGVSVLGGQRDLGTVYKVNPDGTGLTAVYEFVGADGKYPSTLIESGCVLYGSSGFY